MIHAESSLGHHFFQVPMRWAGEGVYYCQRRFAISTAGGEYRISRRITGFPLTGKGQAVSGWTRSAMRFTATSDNPASS